MHAERETVFAKSRGNIALQKKQANRASESAAGRFLSFASFVIRKIEVLGRFVTWAFLLPAWID